MSDVSGNCTKTRKLNHYRASHPAIRMHDHAVTNYSKKYFLTQKSDKTARFGSEIVWIRIRQIRNSKVPIVSRRSPFISRLQIRDVRMVRLPGEVIDRIFNAIYFFTEAKCNMKLVEN